MHKYYYFFHLKKTSNTFSFEQDFLKNELNDEFQLIQNDQQSKPTNSLISMLKNFTYSRPKHSINTNLPAYSEPINFNNRSQSEQTINKLLPLVMNRKLTLDTSLSKNSRKSSYSSAKSNSTIVPSKIVATIVEDDPRKSTNSIENDDIIGSKLDRRKSTSKSLSINDSIISSQTDYDPPRTNPYLMLSQEDYSEHKSHILHCKFSKDGKYVASVDAQGVIKSKEFNRKNMQHIK